MRNSDGRDGNGQEQLATVTGNNKGDNHFCCCLWDVGRKECGEREREGGVFFLNLYSPLQNNILVPI